MIFSYRDFSLHVKSTLISLLAFKLSYSSVHPGREDKFLHIIMSYVSLEGREKRGDG